MTPKDNDNFKMWFKVLFAVIGFLAALMVSSGAYVYSTVNDKIDTNKHNIINLEQVDSLLGERLDRIDSTLLVNKMLDSINTEKVLERLNGIDSILRKL